MRGVVYIAPLDEVPADGSMIDPALGRFWVSWQDDEAEVADPVLEDSDLDGAEAAIAWGRQRADIVLIRLGNRGDTYFSAGAIDVVDDDGPMPLWPPAAPPPKGWWAPAGPPPDTPPGRLGVAEPEVR